MLMLLLSLSLGIGICLDISSLSLLLLGYLLAPRCLELLSTFDEILRDAGKLCVSVSEFVRALLSLK
jgi:hypothetical protein